MSFWENKQTNHPTQFKQTNKNPTKLVVVKFWLQLIVPGSTTEIIRREMIPHHIFMPLMILKLSIAVSSVAHFPEWRVVAWKLCLRKLFHTSDHPSHPSVNLFPLCYFHVQKKGSSLHSVRKGLLYTVIKLCLEIIYYNVIHTII